MLHAGRSPVRVSDEVDFFNLPNPSSRTMALGSTQPLTKMSTRKLPGGKKCRRVGLTTLPPSMSRMSENVGASTSRNLKGLHGLYGDNFTFFTFYTMLSNTFCTYSLFNARGQVWRPYRTESKIMGFYILIFTFWSRIFSSPCHPERLWGPPIFLSNGDLGPFPG
jgi:hypothetical protein